MIITFSCFFLILTIPILNISVCLFVWQQCKYETIRWKYSKDNPVCLLYTSLLFAILTYLLRIERLWCYIQISRSSHHILYNHTVFWLKRIICITMPVSHQPRLAIVSILFYHAERWCSRYKKHSSDMFYKNAVRVRTLTDRYVVSLDIYKSDFIQKAFASILLSELDEGWTTTLGEAGGCNVRNRQNY